MNVQQFCSTQKIAIVFYVGTQGFTVIYPGILQCGKAQHIFIAISNRGEGVQTVVEQVIEAVIGEVMEKFIRIFSTTGAQGNTGLAVIVGSIQRIGEYIAFADNEDIVKQKAFQPFGNTFHVQITVQMGYTYELAAQHKRTCIGEKLLNFSTYILVIGDELQVDICLFHAKTDKIIISCPIPCCKN